MNMANSWAMDIIGPAILLITLIGLAIRSSSNHSAREMERSGKASRASYRIEEKHRREGTEQL